MKRKADINRVCVKASPAEGRRRLHRNTDYIDCPKLGLGPTWSWPNLVLAKLQPNLAKLGLGQTWSRPPRPRVAQGAAAELAPGAHESAATQCQLRCGDVICRKACSINVIFEANRPMRPLAHTGLFLTFGEGCRGGRRGRPPTARSQTETQRFYLNPHRAIRFAGSCVNH